MTDPRSEQDDRDEEPESEPIVTRADSFKPPTEVADNQNVNDTVGRPRMYWSSVTDTGGADTAGAATQKSSFQFDLGGALAKLGDTEPEPPAEAPVESVDPPAVAASDERSALDIGPLVLPRRHASADPAATGPSEAASLPAHQPSAPSGSSATLNPANPEDPLPVRAPAAYVEPLPVRDPGIPTESLPTRQPPSTPEPLPTRGATIETSPSPEALGLHGRAPSPSADLSSRTYVSPHRSVFDDPSAPTSPAAPVASSAAIDPDLLDRAAASLTVAAAAPVFEPTVDAPSGEPLLPTLPKLPTLPPAVPAAPPPVAAPIDSAPSVADVTAARTAQLRAQRKQRQGRVLKRTVLAFILVGGTIGAALMFGRSYLFPTKWDPTLTPVVDEVQREHSAEFERTVTLVRQPAAEYAATVGRLTIGEGWVTKVPEWRALGVASGDVNLTSVGTAIAAQRFAVYDPEADRIFIADDTSTAVAALDLRVAVEAAFAAQQGDEPTLPASTIDGLLGVSGFETIAERAVAVNHAVEAGAAAELVDPADDANGVAVPTGLPLPIEYELRAVDELAQLVIEAGVPSANLPQALSVMFDDEPVTSAGGVLAVGDRPLADATSIGVDDWSLVWHRTLPASMVDRLANAVQADSYQPFDRGGATCVMGAFDTASAADGSYALSALTNWANAMPVPAQAVATSVSPTRVQVVSCDPGVDAVFPSNTDVVDQVFVRQLARLS